MDIYTFASEKIDAEDLDVFDKKWDIKYLMIAKSWKSSWDYFIAFYLFFTIFIK